MFCSMGNGISVCDRLHEKNGDYVSVAHIDANRKVTFHINVDQEYKDEIEKYAAESDPKASTSQDYKVFKTRPAV